MPPCSRRWDKWAYLEKQPLEEIFGPFSAPEPLISDRR